MDSFLRSFIKFHGYFIGIGGIILAIYLTVDVSMKAIGESNDLSGFIFFILIGILWMVACVLLLAGIFIEKKQLIYPFCTMFASFLFLYTVGFINALLVNPWFPKYWVQMFAPFWVLLYDPVFPIVVVMIVHIILSMKALLRLFDLEANSSSSEAALV